MKCISQLPKLHAIEIIHCHVDEVPPLLSDCESLAILRMSHNRLRKFSEDFARCSRLEQLIVDYNDISEINAGIFSARGFHLLEVINMAHNALTALPPDFGITAKGHIRQIDLSNNNIQSIPDSILSCRSLEELNLSHNRLKQLPREFKLPRLQKLFLSFNELTCLPEDIGRCISLTKIRIIHNQIKELPDSIIELWPKKPGGRGKLEQFLVERNPLVMPSITAFELDGGGIDRAFQLLYEHIYEKRKQKELDAKALEYQQPSVLEENSAFERLRVEAPRGDSHEEEPASAGDYYFGHCQGDAAKIGEIRDAESTLLLLKKNMFLHSQRRLAEEVLEGGDAVPDNLKLFLEPDYMDKFHGIVPVRDLDIYFNLLVFSMKTQFPSCQQLFIKFEDGDKGYLTQEEWGEFCLVVPIYVEDAIKDHMWQLMAFRRSDRVPLCDFVAAWHIHDIELQDPFVQSMAKVLQLDYYDMTIKELSDRIKSKGARDATPQLDFDNPEEKPDLHTHAISLQDSEGLRAVRKRLAEAAARSDQVVNTARSADRKKHSGHELVSLTDAQYSANAVGDMDDADDAQSTGSTDDGALSNPSMTEDSDFEAATVLRHQEQKEMQLEAANPKWHVKIDSDEALHQLMELPLEKFYVPEIDLGDAEGGAAQKGKASMLTEDEDKKPNVVAGSKQDTVLMRQALRRVYRNMPHNDFVSLINYLLRALQKIKHQGGNIYWHADDPAFRSVLGEKGANEYTRRLLLQLGFVRLTEVHWVWPSPIFDTPHRVISKEVDKHRLDRVITLLKSCQMNLYKTQHNFTGYFTILH